MLAATSNSSGIVRAFRFHGLVMPSRGRTRGGWCGPSRRAGGPAGGHGGRCRAGSCRRLRPPAAAGRVPVAAEVPQRMAAGRPAKRRWRGRGVGVDAGQHTAHGRLVGWLPGAGQRVAAGPERGQDLTGRISGPLADGGQGPRAGQHRADRDAEHTDQRGPSATPVAGVGDLGQVAEQTTALVGCQRRRRSQSVGSRSNGG